MTDQLTLSLEPTLTTRHPSLKACIAAGIYQRGLVAVAGKIDQRPSHLSEALSGADRRKFDVDDLERYIDETGDTTPVLYLIAKFMRDPEMARRAALERLSTALETIPGLLADAELQTRAPRRAGSRR